MNCIDLTDKEARDMLDTEQRSMIRNIIRPIVRVQGIGKVTEVQRSATPGYSWQFRDKHQLWNDLKHLDMINRCTTAGATDEN